LKIPAIDKDGRLFEARAIVGLTYAEDGTASGGRRRSDEDLRTRDRSGRPYSERSESSKRCEDELI